MNVQQMEEIDTLWCDLFFARTKDGRWELKVTDDASGTLALHCPCCIYAFAEGAAKILNTIKSESKENE